MQGAVACSFQFPVASFQHGCFLLEAGNWKLVTVSVSFEFKNEWSSY